MATVAQHKDHPAVWIVEYIDGDGGIEVAHFGGPNAEDRARAYMKWAYSK